MTEKFKLKPDPYQRAYYTGIASERSGQALLHRGGMGSAGNSHLALHTETAYEPALED